MELSDEQFEATGSGKSQMLAIETETCLSHEIQMSAWTHVSSVGYMGRSNLTNLKACSIIDTIMVILLLIGEYFINRVKMEFDKCFRYSKKNSVQLWL